MPKSTIFLSHISEEAELVALFEGHIGQQLAGGAHIFSSSNEYSIYAGDNWLDKIRDAINDSMVMLVFCSEKSIQRPWVNFEVGAAWISDIPIIAICHTGLAFTQLPDYLRITQALHANDVTHLQSLYARLNEELIKNTYRLKSPNIDYDALASQMAEFEHNYGHTYRIRDAINALIEIDDQFAIFRPDASAQSLDRLLVPVKSAAVIQTHLDLLVSDGYATTYEQHFTLDGRISFSNISRTAKFDAVVNDIFPSE